MMTTLRLDLVWGLALLLMRAVNVRVRIVTNGGMGYTSVVDEEHIQAVRRRETKKSFDYLGVRDFDWYGYPDGGLTPHLGRRSVKMPGPGAPHEVEGTYGAAKQHCCRAAGF